MDQKKPKFVFMGGAIASGNTLAQTGSAIFFHKFLSPFCFLGFSRMKAII
jgi:hypothetical protein